MSEILERALGWLGQQQPAMERLLAELVELTSHSPDRAGNTRVAERYADALGQLAGGGLGGGVVPSASGEHGAHVSMGNGGDGAVLLIGHHDTVFPANVFSGFRED